MADIDGARDGAHGAAGARRLPAEPGMWIIIFGDLLIFGLFFVVYAAYFRDGAAAWMADQAQLSRGIGLANTLLLLTSSLFVALAVTGRTMPPARRRRDLRLGMMFGAGFVVLKAFEWSLKFGAGITIATSPFFMFYFTLGGIHLAHVVIGLGVLTLAQARGIRPPGAGPEMLLEGAGLFWHLVDLLWLFLFALFYLVKP